MATVTPDIQAQMDAAAQQQGFYASSVEGSGPGGNYSLNPSYYASPTATAALANILQVPTASGVPTSEGGTITGQMTPGSPFQNPNANLLYTSAGASNGQGGSGAGLVDAGQVLSDLQNLPAGLWGTILGGYGIQDTPDINAQITQLLGANQVNPYTAAATPAGSGGGAGNDPSQTPGAGGSTTTNPGAVTGGLSTYQNNIINSVAATGRTGGLTTQPSGAAGGGGGTGPASGVGRQPVTPTAPNTGTTPVTLQTGAAGGGGGNAPAQPAGAAGRTPPTTTNMPNATSPVVPPAPQPQSFGVARQYQNNVNTPQSATQGGSFFIRLVNFLF